MNRSTLNGNAASIREVCDGGLLAGAVTVVWQRGELLQVNEIGYRDVGAGVPMSRDTVFRIASMTKPVTVAAAMSLVDEGKLTLKDPVSRWAPELAAVRVLDDPHGPLDRTHPARRAILIEDLRGDHVCSSIDLMVSEQHWNKALGVVAGWSRYSIVDSLECSARGVFYPATGPTLTLHTGFAPFGAPVLSADRLLARARRNPRGILIPAAADFLRLRLAGALFSDLALDLAALRAVRSLMRTEVLTAARAEARREGWGPGFDMTLATAGGVMERLDRGDAVEVPVPVRVPAPEVAGSPSGRSGVMIQ